LENRKQVEHIHADVDFIKRAFVELEIDGFQEHMRQHRMRFIHVYNTNPVLLKRNIRLNQDFL
jgi:hypothetical protein